MSRPRTPPPTRPHAIASSSRLPDAPFLNHAVRHHGQITLVPPENAGRLRKPKPKPKGLAITSTAEARSLTAAVLAADRPTHPHRVPPIAASSMPNVTARSSQSTTSGAPRSPAPRTPRPRSPRPRSPNPTRRLATTSAARRAASPSPLSASRRTPPRTIPQQQQQRQQPRPVGRSAAMKEADELTIPDFPPPSFWEAVSNPAFAPPLPPPPSFAAPIPIRPAPPVPSHQNPASTRSPTFTPNQNQNQSYLRRDTSAEVIPRMATATTTTTTSTPTNARGLVAPLSLRGLPHLAPAPSRSVFGSTASLPLPSRSPASFASPSPRPPQRPSQLPISTRQISTSSSSDLSVSFSSTSPSVYSDPDPLPSTFAYPTTAPARSPPQSGWEEDRICGLSLEERIRREKERREVLDYGHVHFVTSITPVQEGKGKLKERPSVSSVAASFRAPQTLGPSRTPGSSSSTPRPRANPSPPAVAAPRTPTPTRAAAQDAVTTVYQQPSSLSSKVSGVSSNVPGSSPPRFASAAAPTSIPALTPPPARVAPSGIQPSTQAQGQAVAPTAFDKQTSALRPSPLRSESEPTIRHFPSVVPIASTPSKPAFTRNRNGSVVLKDVTARLVHASSSSASTSKTVISHNANASTSTSTSASGGSSSAGSARSSLTSEEVTKEGSTRSSKGSGSLDEHVGQHAIVEPLSVLHGSSAVLAREVAGPTAPVAGSPTPLKTVAIVEPDRNDTVSPPPPTPPPKSPGRNFFSFRSPAAAGDGSNSNDQRRTLATGVAWASKTSLSPLAVNAAQVEHTTPAKESKTVPSTPATAPSRPQPVRAHTLEDLPPPTVAESMASSSSNNKPKTFSLRPSTSTPDLLSSFTRGPKFGLGKKGGKRKLIYGAFDVDGVVYGKDKDGRDENADAQTLAGDDCHAEQTADEWEFVEETDLRAVAKGGRTTPPRVVFHRNPSSSSLHSLTFPNDGLCRSGSGRLGKKGGWGGGGGSLSASLDGPPSAWRPEITVDVKGKGKADSSSGLPPPSVPSGGWSAPSTPMAAAHSHAGSLDESMENMYDTTVSVDGSCEEQQLAGPARPLGPTTAFLNRPLRRPVAGSANAAVGHEKKESVSAPVTPVVPSSPPGGFTPFPTISSSFNLNPKRLTPPRLFGLTFPGSATNSNNNSSTNIAQPSQSHRLVKPRRGSHSSHNSLSLAPLPPIAETSSPEMSGRSLPSSPVSVLQRVASFTRLRSGTAMVTASPRSNDSGEPSSSFVGLTPISAPPTIRMIPSISSTITSSLSTDSYQTDSSEVILMDRQTFANPGRAPNNDGFSTEPEVIVPVAPSRPVLAPSSRNFETFARPTANADSARRPEQTTRPTGVPMASVPSVEESVASIGSFSEYTDFDLLLSRIENLSQSEGSEYESLTMISEFLGAARSENPFTDEQFDTIVLRGVVEVERRRVTHDGRVKVKLSMLGVAVDRCVVCINQFKEKDKGAVLRCQHAFHEKCCRRWLKNSRTCPTCRAPVFVEGEQ